MEVEYAVSTTDDFCTYSGDTVMHNDYVKGIQQGRADGAEGENRLASRAAKRLLNIGSYLPGAENRDQQFRKGYVDGFEDEMRQKRVVLSKPVHPVNHKETTMSQQTSFAHQIELLQSLKSYLGEFQERLLGVSENYQRKVEALHDEGGLMDETYRDFVEHQVAETRTLITQLVDHIGDNDIPAVEREVNYLEQKL